LRRLYEGAGIDPKKPVVTSCGSGLTACALAFGLHLIGHRDVAVYDGSWAEWGLPGDTPVET
jgi:thiosulfate/3-mercaptopyruvate sulfurtransferase